jgi:hypothetical protein
LRRSDAHGHAAGQSGEGEATSDTEGSKATYCGDIWPWTRNLPPSGIGPALGMDEVFLAGEIVGSAAEAEAGVAASLWSISE